jgi:DNA-binding HxlR family transcriptional regulator
MNSFRQNELRSDCPLNFAIETIGDKWSLIILRDMIFWGKKTYREFLKSDEKIATNVLAGRLEFLEKVGFITKSPHATDRRKEVYSLTKKGLELVPVLIELIVWSARSDVWRSMKHSPTVRVLQRFMKRAVRKNKAKLIKDVKESAQKGSSFFDGVLRVEHQNLKR